MSTPVYEYQLTAQLSLVKKVPDARYKTGFRSRQVIGRCNALLLPEIGTELALHQVESTPSGVTEHMAVVTVNVGKRAEIRRVLS